MLFRIIIILFFCLLRLSVYTQDLQSTQVLNITFSVYSIDEIAQGSIYYSSNGKFKPIEFWPYERSMPHRFKGRLLNFYQRLKDDAGDDVFRLINSMTGIRKSGKYLFFFLPTKSETDLACEIVGISDKLSDFPLNSLVFLNASGINLQGHLWDTALMLQPGHLQMISTLKFDEQETLVELSGIDGGSTQKLLSNYWTFYSNYREIIVLLPPNHGASRLRVHRFSQHKDELKFLDQDK